MHVVRLTSLADELDEVDPRVRGAARSFRPAEPRREEAPVLPMVTKSPGFISSELVSLTNYLAGSSRKKNGQARKRVIRLPLPDDIARRVADRREGVAFEVELNDDGILFRPANGHSTQVTALPSWIPSNTQRAKP